MKRYNKETFVKIEGFVDDYRLHNHFNPSIAEIADQLQMAKATIARYLHRMTELGILQYYGPRSIVTKKCITNSNMITIPICGTIQC
jgi:AraC-like DNA-binding protein